MSAGLPAVLGLAAGAFASTNIDNAVVTVAMVAAAPPERARRIAAGQVVGFATLVLAALGMALLLFEISTRVIGLLGLVPLALGIRGPHRAPTRREPGSHGAPRLRRAASSRPPLVTIGAGGDNLAVYIPLFRVAHVRGTIGTLLVFAVCEVLLTLFILWAGRHPRVRRPMTAIGVVATPILYCVIGILVLARGGHALGALVSGRADAGRPSYGGQRLRLFLDDPARALRLVIGLQVALRRRRHVVVDLHHRVGGGAVELVGTEGPHRRQAAGKVLDVGEGGDEGAPVQLGPGVRRRLGKEPDGGAPGLDRALLLDVEARCVPLIGLGCALCHVA